MFCVVTMSINRFKKTLGESYTIIVKQRYLIHKIFVQPKVKFIFITSESGEYGNNFHDAKVFFHSNITKKKTKKSLESSDGPEVLN